MPGVLTGLMPGGMPFKRAQAYHAVRVGPFKLSGFLSGGLRPGDAAHAGGGPLVLRRRLSGLMPGGMPFKRAQAYHAVRVGPFKLSGFLSGGLRPGDAAHACGGPLVLRRFLSGGLSGGLRHGDAGADHSRRGVNAHPRRFARELSERLSTILSDRLHMENPDASAGASAGASADASAGASAAADRQTRNRGAETHNLSFGLSIERANPLSDQRAASVSGAYRGSMLGR